MTFLTNLARSWKRKWFSFRCKQTLENYFPSSYVKITPPFTLSNTVCYSITFFFIFLFFFFLSLSFHYSSSLWVLKFEVGFPSKTFLRFVFKDSSTFYFLLRKRNDMRQIWLKFNLSWKLLRWKIVFCGEIFCPNGQGWKSGFLTSIFPKEHADECWSRGPDDFFLPATGMECLISQSLLDLNK